MLEYVSESFLKKLTKFNSTFQALKMVFIKNKTYFFRSKVNICGLTLCLNEKQSITGFKGLLKNVVGHGFLTVHCSY